MRRKKRETTPSTLVTVVLLRDHVHAGVVYHPGNKLTLRAYQADHLRIRGVAK